MPFLRIKEIRELSLDKRTERLNELRSELSRLRAMVKVGGSIENPSRIREIKRAVARILTVETEKRTGAKVKE